MEAPAALRPILEAADDIRRLEEYDGPDELNAAIRATTAALERSLRLQLRADASAPESERLGALSDSAIPVDEVVRSLRARDTISIETAGTIHEALAAGRRAEDGDARASDADVVRAAVTRVREDLGVADTPPVAGGSDAGGPAGEDAGAGVGEGAESGNPTPPEAAAARTPDTSADTGRWMAWIAAAVAVAFVLGAAWVTLRGGSADFDEAVQLFRADRLDTAAVAFEQVLERRPQDVTAMLYLGRTYRRLGQVPDAAQVLRRAVEEDGEDADVRRELGHLFMDLDRPRSAISQYERALEYDPEEPLNWAALIRALQAQGDPRAEQLLRDAPPEIQAALGGA